MLDPFPQLLRIGHRSQLHVGLEHVLSQRHYSTIIHTTSITV